MNNRLLFLRQENHGKSVALKLLNVFAPNILALICVGVYSLSACDTRLRSDPGFRRGNAIFEFVLPAGCADSSR